MSAPPTPEEDRPRRRVGAWFRQVLAAVWGSIAAAAPHVLHHVGPLAGAAVLAGTGGRLIFFAIGLVASMPMLWRLHRRFRSWVAPAIAVGIFSIAYLVSSYVVGLAIGGDSAGTDSVTPTTHGHEH